MDPASAALEPLFQDFEALGRNEYEPRIAITLPIFVRFSRLALVGIIAHEFAHAFRARRLGDGWHEKMQARYDAEERLANTIAARWDSQFKSPLCGGNGRMLSTRSWKFTFPRSTRK